MPNDSGAMERLRADLLRRAQEQREADLELSIARDLESQAAPEMVQERRRSGIGGFAGMAIPRIFGRRNQPPSPSPDQLPVMEREIPEVRLEQGDQLEEPKTPPISTRRMSNMRFTLPNFSRMWSSGANGPASPAGTEWPTNIHGPQTPRYFEYENEPDYPHPSVEDTLRQPEPVSHARSTFRPPSSHYTDIFLTGSSERRPNRARDERRKKRRRRRHHHVRNEHRRQHSDGRSRRNKPNRKFLFCFPWPQSRAMRANILRCFVSGLFLVALLSVYLGLSVTNNVGMSDFTIVLILIVVLATLFFAYGLVRLCLLVIRGDQKKTRRPHLAQDTIMGHYAVPHEPIRVTLARDEEATGVEGEATKMTPPAYGLWRESVRVDPDRLFWQRNEETRLENVEERPETSASRRPPSYISDDGVSYVVEAQPRSTAPSSDVPLPPHPSEMGRVVLPASHAGW